MFIALTLQQWLDECTSKLHHTYIACTMALNTVTVSCLRHNYCLN